METDIDYFKNYVLAKTNEGFDMLVGTNDQYIGYCIKEYGEWEPHLMNQLKHYIKPGMTVVDIGANIGFHTLLMAKLVGPSGKVHGFEPCGAIHKVLMYNCIINQFYNTKLYQLGCGDVSETRYINNQWNESEIFTNYGCIYLLSDKNQENRESFISNKTPVEVRKLDDFDFKIDVIKIDAEGMEEQIIKGMKNKIEQYKPIILVEVHNTELETMQKLFEELNYSLDYIGGIDYVAKYKN